MVIGTYISIITLNVNGLNAPTKRHTLAEWIQKQDSYICCLKETHFRPRDAYRLKVRGWKKIFHANRNQKKAGVAILMSDKIDFKIKTCYKRQGRTLHNDQGMGPCHSNHSKFYKNGFEDTGRGKGKLGRSERVAWTYIHYQM